jgi:hypothetical protein
MRGMKATSSVLYRDRLFAAGLTVDLDPSKAGATVNDSAAERDERCLRIRSSLVPRLDNEP